MSSPGDGQLDAIRLSLQAIESQITAGKVPAKSLEDFKSAVDEVRLRIWAIMSAQQMADGSGALKRFRMRRAIEMLDSVTEDLKDPSSTSPAKELDQLIEAASRFSSQVEARNRTG